jgi:hypothetical protein
MTVEDKLQRAARMDDPHEKALYLQQVVMPEVDALRKRVLDGRALAVLEANDAGHGYSRLAADLGVSKGLVQNLLRSGRELRDGVTDPCTVCGKRQVYAKGLCYLDWQAQLGKTS